METRASRKILLVVLFAVIGQFSFAQSKVPSTPEEKRAAFLTPPPPPNTIPTGWGLRFSQFRQWRKSLMLPLPKFWT